MKSNPKDKEVNKIILGDCLEVMRGMADNSVDLVLTDPPYGKSWTRNNKTPGFGSQGNKAWRTDELTWDKFTPTQEYFDEMIRVSKNQIIFGGNYFTDKLPVSNCWIVWDKIGNHKFSNPFADCELAWTSFSKVIKKYVVVQQGFVKDTKDKRLHPTQKPTELMKAIIVDFAETGQKILDPFVGSGSTIKAAKDLGFNATGIEINPDYVKIAQDRLKQEVLL